jgi:hypothetical protein
VLDYELNAKPAALADFKKALELDPAVKRQFELPVDPQPGRGQRMKPIIEDAAFMKELFGK